MTDEQKEIQAIAKLLFGHYCGKDECGKCKMPNCAEYLRAKRIYEAGFRDAAQIRKETVKEVTYEILQRLTNELLNRRSELKHFPYDSKDETTGGVSEVESIVARLKVYGKEYGVEVGK